MNNKSYLFAVLFCAVSKLQADAPQNTDQLKTSVELSQGYRRDNLTTKFSRHNFDSYKYKGKYKGVDTYTTRLSMAASKNDFFVKGAAGYGNVYGGKFHQKIAHYSAQTDIAHLTSHVKGDYTADFNLAFGKDFFLANDWQVSPSVGYGVYVQDFHTNHAKGHYDVTSARNGNSHGKARGHVKSGYKAIWYSPQFGLSVQKALTNSLSAYANYTFLFPLSYTAKGHHKFGDYSYRYEQENKAYKSLGNIGTVGLNWNFAEGWSLKPEVEVMKFFSKGGDSAHRYNLKKVTRSAAEYRLVLSYLF